jgi:hypothetical protein
MKSAYVCSSALSQRSYPMNRLGVPPTVVTELLPIAAAVAFLLLSGCATDKSTGMTVSGGQPLAQDILLRLGTVALVPDLRPATFGFDKAKGQIGAPGEWAGTAAGNMLGLSTSEPIANVPLSPIAVLLTPFSAIKAVVQATERLNPDKLSECETNLVNAMREMAAQQRFHEWLLKAAGEGCRGRLIALDPLLSGDPRLVSADSMLDARVEELRLERTGSGDTSYRLRIRIRMRLVRTADGVVLADQPFEYCSGKSLFLDWTLHDAFRRVADTGYRLLAEKSVSQLLTTTDKPTLLGADQPRTPAPDRNAAVRVASRQPSLNQPFVRPVNYRMVSSSAFGVFSTGDVTHVTIPRPLSRDEAGSEAQEEMNEDFKGLIDHPNMLVAGPSIAVAIPIGLWKQFKALVRGLSPRKLQEADAKLSAAANETRPHQELAVQVAQQLEPHTSQPVMVVQQPPLPGAEEDADLRQYMQRGTFASLTGGQTASGHLLSQGVETALEIHVEDARLAGNGGINPKLALCVEARATLLRSRDGQQLYSCPLQYRSKARHFTTWAAHDAKLFREELQKCYHDLSASVVERLVRSGLLPAEGKPAPVFAGK